MYCVYKHTSPKGKVYIGITMQEPERRWQGGYGYVKNTVFWRAIKKYGWDSFKHEIIRSGLSRDDACDLERELVAKYNATDRRYGYNITPGGDIPWHVGRKLSAEHRAKIGMGEKGANNPNARCVICLETLKVYKTITDAMKETGATKIGSCCAHRYKHRTSGGLHWEYYDPNTTEQEYREMLASRIEQESQPYMPTDEVKEKRVAKTRKPIVCIDTGIMYKSIHDAADKLNVSAPNICNCCKGKKKSAGGYRWEYAKEVS